MNSLHLYRRTTVLLFLLVLTYSSLMSSRSSTATTTCTNPSLSTSATLTLTNRPRAVLVDDFNNDGKPDLASAGSASFNPISISLGNGDGTFAPAINSNAGRNPLSLESADFNGDGKRDLLIGNSSTISGLATIILGNGSGGFGSPNPVFLLSGTSATAPAVASGDVTSDNKADGIIVATTGLGSSFIFVMAGDGNGNLTSVSTFASGGNASAINLADLNNDGKLDIVVLNLQPGPQGTVVTFLGDGTGHFGSGSPFPVGGFPVSMVISDFNSDGKKDIAVANQASNDVSILFGDGSGGLGGSTTIPNVGEGPWSLAKADYDGDAKIDLIVLCAMPGTATLLINQGSGLFSAVGNFFFGPPPLSTEKLAAIEGDLNLDSKPDLAVVNQSQNKAWVLLNSCDTTPAQTQLLSNSFAGLESIGLNPPLPGSALVTVIRTGSVTGSSTIDYSTSDETAVAGQDYTSVSGTLSFAPGETYKPLAVPMLDDNITETLESFKVSLNNANGSSGLGTPNTAEVFIIDDEPLPAININDVSITEGDSGNASADFLVTLSNPSASAVTVKYQTANDSATAGSDYQSVSGTLTFAPLQVSQTISVPVSGDTLAEVNETFFVNLTAPTNATISKGQGLGKILDDEAACPEPSFNPVTNFTVGMNPFDLVAGDFNGDSKTDLVVANLESGNVSYLTGNGSGGFGPATNIAVGDRPVSIASGDFNSDQKLDVVVIRETNNFIGGISVLLNNGSGGFLPPTSTAIANLRDGTVSDLNGDGKLDLVLLSNSIAGAGSVSVMLGDGSGGFGSPSNYAAGTSSMDVVAANVNADTKPDLVVANQNSNDISVLINNGDGTFGSATNIATGLNPQQILPGDLNSDGKIDLVVPLSSTGAIAILLGDGTGMFSARPNLTVGVRADRGVLADFNGDNFLDLAISDLSESFSSPMNAGVWVMFGNGSGSFTVPTQYVTAKSPYGIVAGNFDAGVRTDLAFVQLQSTSVGVLLNSCGLNPPGPSVQFTGSNVSVSEAVGSVSINIVRSGNVQTAVSVDYFANDNTPTLNCSVNSGKASSRCDYLATLGTLNFTANETSKTISIPIVDDGYAEGNETFTVTLSNSSGAVLGTPSTLTINIVDNDSQSGPNPIDLPSFFVRQHYLDFLNREPDQSGIDFWISNFTQCGGDPQCIAVRRINVSAAFFLSIEFQQTGYLMERSYKVAYGDRNATSTINGVHPILVPMIRLNEFLSDSQKITKGVVVGQGNWEQILESNKQHFFQEFVLRPRFVTAYPTLMTAAEFVDQLNENAGKPLSSAARDDLVNGLAGGQLTRDQVLRTIAEDPVLNTSELNRAFVLMQYFGYLRRNPDDTPDSDYTGYDFWLTKLNQFNGNFVNAEMVKAFIQSTEYRQRFGSSN